MARDRGAEEPAGEVHPFHRDLEALGFELVRERGTVYQYRHQATRYLTYWVHWDVGAGTCLFTWELAIGELVHDHGLQIGANEFLNLYLFPQRDAVGPADATFVAAEMDRAERILSEVRLTAG